MSIEMIKIGVPMILEAEFKKASEEALELLQKFEDTIDELERMKQSLIQKRDKAIADLAASGKVNMIADVVLEYQEKLDSISEKLKAATKISIVVKSSTLWAEWPNTYIVTAYKGKYAVTGPTSANGKRKVYSFECAGFRREKVDSPTGVYYRVTQLDKPHKVAPLGEVVAGSRSFMEKTILGLLGAESPSSNGWQASAIIENIDRFPILREAIEK